MFCKENGVETLADSIESNIAKPIYGLNANASMQILGTDTATYALEGKNYSHSCEAVLRLSPRPGLVFQARVPEGQVSIPQLLGMGDLPTEFFFRGKKITGFFGGYHIVIK